MLNLLASMEVGEWNPHALAAKVHDDLNPSWEMAMNGLFCEGYIESQHLEIETLQKMDVWDIVDRQPWMNVLPSIMVFRKKVFPNGKMRKLKVTVCRRTSSNRRCRFL